MPSVSIDDLISASRNPPASTGISIDDLIKAKKPKTYTDRLREQQEDIEFEISQRRSSLPFLGQAVHKAAKPSPLGTLASTGNVMGQLLAHAAPEALNYGLEISEGTAADVLLGVQRNKSGQAILKDIGQTIIGKRPAQIGDVVRSAGLPQSYKPISDKFPFNLVTQKQATEGLAATAGIMAIGASPARAVTKAGNLVRQAMAIVRSPTFAATKTTEAAAAVVGKIAALPARWIARETLAPFRAKFAVPEIPKFDSRTPKLELQKAMDQLNSSEVAVVEPLKKMVDEFPAKLRTSVGDIVNPVKDGLTDTYRSLNSWYGKRIDQIFASATQKVPTDRISSSISGRFQSRGLMDNSGKWIPDRLAKATSIENDVVGIYKRMFQKKGVEPLKLFGPSGEFLTGLETVPKNLPPVEINRAVKSLREKLSSGFKAGTQSATAEDRFILDIINDIGEAVAPYYGRQLQRINRVYAKIRNPLNEAMRVFQPWKKTSAIDRGGRILESLPKRTPNEIRFLRTVEDLTGVKFVDDLQKSFTNFDTAKARINDIKAATRLQRVKLRREYEETVYQAKKRLEPAVKEAKETIKKTGEELSSGIFFGIGPPPKRVAGSSRYYGKIGEVLTRPFRTRQAKSIGLREALNYFYPELDKEE